VTDACDWIDAMLRPPARSAQFERAVRSAGVVAMVAVVLVSGCSTDSGTPGGFPSTQAVTTTSPSAAQASSTHPVDAADAVQGKSGRYAVLPPQGWGDATDEVGAMPGVDLVMMSSEKQTGFNTNLVVHVATGDTALLESELQKGREQLADQGRAVADAPPITVGGSPATGFTTSFTQQGVEVVARSYGLHQEGRVYLLTLSSARSAAEQAAAELAEIAESWTWM
jgi:hypothetical protein